MKKLYPTLALVILAGASHASTIFDSIYADAGQTTLRTNAITPGTFDNTFFLTGHYVASEFTVGSAASLSYIQFGFQNNSKTAATTTLTGTVEIFDSVNPHNGEANYSGIAYPNAAGTAQADPMVTLPFSVNVSVDALGTGIAGFSLPTSVSLAGGKTYGFAIRTASSTITPSASAGTTLGAGSPFTNIVHYDYGDTGTIPASGIYWPNKISSVSYALYTAAPVPEPTTIAALGLGAVAMIRRRKRA